MYRLIGIICLLMVLMLGATPAFSAEVEADATEVIITPQAVCPIMKGDIDKSLYVDHDGKRIYACCQGCIDELKNAPGKYIKQLETEGITLDKTPPQLCPKCGEIKGSETCCNLEGRTKCEKCGLLKGSPGCCNIPEGTKEPLDLCQKCGEIKGSEKCCNKEGRTRCEKCGLFKDSPGCCKIELKCDKSLLYCLKCGELKGSEKCCGEEGRVRCEKCGMFKGSPCCCKMDAEGNLLEATDKFEKAQEQYEETADKVTTE